MEWTWLLLFAILVFIEASTINLFTIWFAVGSLGAFITTLFTSDVVIQCAVFTIVTTVSLILTRPLVKKLLKGRTYVRTNLDSVVGHIGIVSEIIKPTSIGRVTVFGKDWAAKSNETIEQGSEVLVLAIEGVKLIVKKKEEE